MAEYLQQPFSWQNGLLFFLWGAIFLGLLLGFVAYAIYFERKFIGWMQFRIGPNRVGPFGLFQSFADILKLLIKEDTIPKAAVRDLFIIAPALTFIPAFVVLATIPYTPSLIFADLNIGIMFYMSISSISTIGIILGGWASNNKYALLGGMRSAAQMISYEIPLFLSVVGVLLMTGTLNLREMVEYQQGGIWNWNVWPQIIGFVIFVIAAVSELNRTPFDLPEAESELVAGYHVEYSGFRFAFFMLAEYVYVFAFASVSTIVFLGGWDAPIPQLAFIPGIVWFLLKFSLFVFFLFWIRATLPRVRVDQLMGLAWKVLLPIALVNILLTAIGIEIFN